MLPLRAEHSGDVGILLVLYAIQIYMGTRINPADYEIKIWINNTEVLARGGTKVCGNSIKERTVLDYDLWMVMDQLKKTDTISIMLA